MLSQHSNASLEKNFNRAVAKSCDRRSALTPLSLSGRGGVGRILVRNLPSPREGEGLGVRAGG